MLKREKGWDLRSDDDDLWKAVRMECGETSVYFCDTAFLINVDCVHRYFNTVTQEISCLPPPEFKGGILADSMGLGKSLSMIALLAMHPTSRFHEAAQVYGQASTLLVVPFALLQTWDDELSRHLHPGVFQWCIYHRSRSPITIARLLASDIVITTYDTIASQWRNAGRGDQCLLSTSWNRIVLDEGSTIS